MANEDLIGDTDPKEGDRFVLTKAGGSWHCRRFGQPMKTGIGRTVDEAIKFCLYLHDETPETLAARVIQRSKLGLRTFRFGPGD